MTSLLLRVSFKMGIHVCKESTFKVFVYRTREFTPFQDRETEKPVGLIVKHTFQVNLRSFFIRLPFQSEGRVTQDTGHGLDSPLIRHPYPVSTPEVDPTTQPDTQTTYTTSSFLSLSLRNVSSTFLYDTLERLVDLQNCDD